MSNPRRVSLRDRNAAAIAGEEPDEKPAPKPATAPARPRAARKEPSAAAPQRRRTPPTPDEGEEKRERLGTYWQKATFDQSRAAYVVDLDHRDDPPVGFARWVEAALSDHIDRTPAERAAIAHELGEEPTGVGVQRALVLSEQVIRDVEAAVVAERRAGRLLSVSQFVVEAARNATAEARARYGNELPPPPKRLPTRPSR